MSTPHSGNRGASPAVIEQGRVTREEILKRASQLLSRRPASGVSLSEIAMAAGVSKAGLLHHFPSKVALVSAALDVRDAVDLIDRGQPPVGLAMLRLLASSTEAWADHPELVGVFTTQLIDNLAPGAPLNERLVDRARLARTIISQSLRAGITSGEIVADADPDAEAAIAVAFLNGLETSWLLEPDLPAVELASRWYEQTAERLAARL